MLGPLPRQAQRRADPRDLTSQTFGAGVAGKLHAPVDTVYPIEQIRDALAHADKGGRNGKILVSPNGAI
jgi:NADPH:quinone reductase-like Zn-dependent oxidoreductase